MFEWIKCSQYTNCHQKRHIDNLLFIKNNKEKKLTQLNWHNFRSSQERQQSTVVGRNSSGQEEKKINIESKPLTFKRNELSIQSSNSVYYFFHARRSCRNNWFFIWLKMSSFWNISEWKKANDRILRHLNAFH